MKKLISIVTALFLMVAFSVSSFAADSSTQTQQVIDNNIASDANTDLSTSISEVKDDTVLKSDIKIFKGKFVDLFTELNKLRAECKNLWTSIQTSNQNIKNEWKSLKDSLKDKDKAEVKKILADLKAKLDPIRTQIKALHSDIKNLRTQKTSEWTNFRTAIKARDEAKASTALNNIIKLKKQIIEKQKAILEKKQQILEIIKA